ncbi:MAG: (E)-4-hydroxy-3-methylbut-2-enyl-diphosphate synthase [Flavobacteriales bacterium]|nr:(E)-4-hydroxy-3-methylbut-2-enyl-diphosphate synthase [Flavobacteriales bacterium]
MSDSVIQRIPLFTENLHGHSRWLTREVKIGDVGVGGNNPIRIQSMTTTDTMDTIATVEQTIRMVEFGCEYVRITAPSLKEAKNLQEIKKELKKRGVNVPLIADIHFTPNAAEEAARIVEKVRVNPGNYADKKKFNQIDYTDASYEAEIDRIRGRFQPLVKICKEYGTAMRIGTNHGSLSDRILSRYGDTPEGMVESALEFVRICRDHDYHDIVLSMKASNPQVMVQAYRLLVSQMKMEGMNYPLHLGVTEAGDGEDGRIKSAIGIGALLEDGLGDTVRVSLTEEPEIEGPVAKKIVSPYLNIKSNPQKDLEHEGPPIDFISYNRRATHEVLNIGAKNPPAIIQDYSTRTSISQANLFGIGYQYSIELDKWNIGDMAADYIYIGKNQIEFETPGTLGVIQDYEVWERQKERHYPLLSLEDISSLPKDQVGFLQLSTQDINQIESLKGYDKLCIILSSTEDLPYKHFRKFFLSLIENEIQNPVIVLNEYELPTLEDLWIRSSVDQGTLFLDGLGDGLWIKANFSVKDINNLCFGILQATRTRISKTEYISCPSCGRTLFDLQETTGKIRQATSHLKGVKIGIMGCIVNGPGEMADADYGYVGTGPGKISLYKEKEVVVRNVPEEQAVEALIDLIKSHNDWVDPN